MPGATVNSHRARRVVRRFYRSVRLEMDLQDPAALDGYTITPQVLQVLSRLEEGLRPDSTERAITLTGPYGSGKSAFALFLARLLDQPCPATNPSWEMLARQDPDLAERFRGHLGRVGLLPVAVTARRVPLGRCLAEGLLRAAERLPGTTAIRSLLRELESDLACQSWDSRRSTGHLQALCVAAVESGCYQGVLLVVDELGKALEHAARHPEEDVFLLQDIAELASRSGDQPVMLIGILHQAFEQYGEFLDTASRNEWAKLQGRFSDIAFVEPPEQQMRLAADAAGSLGLAPEAGSDRLVSAAQALAEAGHSPPGLKAADFEELALRAYPLHPTVLMSLPHLFRRFAQNERSLFAYLLGQEPFSLQDHLRRRGPDPVRLADLFDYFSANLSNSLRHHASSRRWLEAADVIEQARNPTSFEVQVLKAIAVLNMLGEVPYLQPSEALLSIAFSDGPGCQNVSVALASLREHSLVVLRRFNNSYRVWEGSDIDVEARLEEGRRKTRGRLGIAHSLHQYLPRRPLAARRHTFEVGALRFFDVIYLDAASSREALLDPGVADGIIVCCLPVTAAEAHAFRKFAARPEVTGRANLIIAVPHQIGALHEAAVELQAAHWVWENTPELQGDRVARRELAERTAAVERELTRRLEHLLDPRPEPEGCRCAWFYQGAEQPLRTPRDVAQLLSAVMDAVYPHSPRIQNELINRRRLSSAAAAARRNLVERMLTHSNQPLLGINGYPPERSMYESVLLASGMHQGQSAGTRSLSPPPEQDPLGLCPVWQAMHEAVFNPLAQPCPVEQLQARLASPPFGLMPGVFPVLLCAFMLVHADETSLYRDGIFVPEPGIADYEVLMRRPELFAVGGSKVKGVRVLVVERMARGLGVEAATVPVVRGLIRMVMSIPEHGWRTQRLSPRVMRVREIFERARSPERLLFQDLPMALDEPPLEEDQPPAPDRVERFFTKLNTALVEWAGATQGTIAASRDKLLTACDLPTGEAGWTHFRTLARTLLGKPVDPGLISLLERVAAQQEDAVVVEGVLALVSGRPPRKWTDRDEDRFASQAGLVANKFVHAVQMHGSLTPTEEAWSASLAARLRERLPADVPRQVVRAALRRILQEL